MSKELVLITTRESRQKASWNLKFTTTMSKKGAATAAQLVKLLVPAGKASAQPPVGPALGAKGVKAMDFAKVCE